MQQLFLQSLKSDQPVPFIKIHTEIIVLLWVWFVWLFAKSRNHQANAMFVCAEIFLMPQILTSGVWDLSGSWIRIVSSPATPSTHAGHWLSWPKHLCFKTGIKDGWSPKIMASVGSSDRTAFLDSPPNISYSMTSKWAAIHGYMQRSLQV